MEDWKDNLKKNAKDAKYKAWLNHMCVHLDANWKARDELRTGEYHCEIFSPYIFHARSNCKIGFISGIECSLSSFSFVGNSSVFALTAKKMVIAQLTDTRRFGHEIGRMWMPDMMHKLV